MKSITHLFLCHFTGFFEHISHVKSLWKCLPRWSRQFCLNKNFLNHLFEKVFVVLWWRLRPRSMGSKFESWQAAELLCTYQCNAGGGGMQGIGWGFDFFQKFAIKFPAHGQIIPVKCNQISPPQAAHCCQSHGRIKISPNKTLQSFISVAASPKMFLLQLQLYVLTIIRVTLRRIRKPLGESAHFVSLNIPFLVKATKNVSFISLQWL